MLEIIDGGFPDIARLVATEFDVSRQAVNKHLRRLVEEGVVSESGATRNKTYHVVETLVLQASFALEGLEEDRVWEREIRPLLADLPAPLLNIWHYGATEMINNAIDHSGGTQVTVSLWRNPFSHQLQIADDGIGIFRKIQQELDLTDPRHALLELSKGKLTTDPSRHTGEGIFFTSRMFDMFEILSEGMYFWHEEGAREDWMADSASQVRGTTVYLQLHDDTQRTSKEIFDQYSSGDDYGFTKTMVPVRLAQYGEDQLVSRSQAKRLLARVEQFTTVLLDFKGVTSIGQAFADEIFRVWTLQHPGIKLAAVNASKEVLHMISRARNAASHAGSQNSRQD